jgi:hypothetical protein
MVQEAETQLIFLAGKRFFPALFSVLDRHFERVRFVSRRDFFLCCKYRLRTVLNRWKFAFFSDRYLHETLHPDFHSRSWPFDCNRFSSDKVLILKKNNH